jgi:hypothetical protein
MHLVIYREISAELLRNGDLAEFGVNHERLVVDEVRLKATEVEVLGWRPGANQTTRRVSATFVYGGRVRVLATDDQTAGVVDALSNALEFARKEWEDRNADVEAAIAPPWRLESAGDHIVVDVRGHWFTIAQHHDLEPTDLPPGESHVSDPVPDDGA